MKHLLLLLLFLGLVPAGQAQSANPAMWCPPGARWTYNYGEMTQFGTVSMWYAGDTIIGGQSAQMLRRSLSTFIYVGAGQYPTGSYALPRVITRAVGNRVEVYAGGQFYTLYDFAAQPGNSWLTPAVYPTGTCLQNIFTVTVDSVGQKQIGGRTLRWFRAHTTSPTNPQQSISWGRVYELVGNINYLQPQGSLCGGTDPGYIGALTAFTATGPPPVNYSFRGSNVVLSAQARADAAGFAIFPNPAAGASRLTVSLPATISPVGQLTLLDIAGRRVREQALIPGQQFDIQGLPAGIYSLVLSSAGQPKLTRRVVLE